MIPVIILLLIVLWFFGYIRIQGFAIPDFVLFYLNGQPITLWSLLIFFVIMWAIGVLPSPLREIAGVLFIIWILSTVGILAVSGLANIIIVALILGLVVSLLRGR